MTEFKYRLCFRLPERGRFSGEEENVSTVADKTQERIVLSAEGSPRQLGQSNRYALTGGPFESGAAATEAGLEAKTALLLYSVRNQVGIDFGRHVPGGGGLTAFGRQLFSEKLGKPVLSDNLGLTVYESDPPSLWAGLHGEYGWSKPTPRLLEEIARTYRRYRPRSKKAELAIELYSGSFFETTPRARFLTLVIAIEALLDPAPRDCLAQEHVESLMNLTESAALPDPEKQSLLGALRWLKRDSISRTGRNMAREILTGKTYDRKDPEKFFEEVYALRSNLVHTGETPDRSSLSVGELQRFVSDLLQAHFVEA